jgi:Ca-activated chloride channel family protein
MQPKKSEITDPNIEAWELTAYALNELDAESRARIEKHLESNPESRAELKEIESIASAIQRQLSTVAPSMALDPARTKNLLDTMSRESSQGRDAIGDPHASKASSVDRTSTPSRTGWTFSRAAVTALCALAATVLIALMVAPESLRGLGKQIGMAGPMESHVAVASESDFATKQESKSNASVTVDEKAQPAFGPGTSGATDETENRYSSTLGGVTAEASPAEGTNPKDPEILLEDLIRDNGSEGQRSLDLAAGEVPAEGDALEEGLKQKDSELRAKSFGVNPPDITSNDSIGVPSDAYVREGMKGRFEVGGTVNGDLGMNGKAVLENETKLATLAETATPIPSSGPAALPALTLNSKRNELAAGGASGGGRGGLPGGGIGGPVPDMLPGGGGGRTNAIAPPFGNSDVRAIRGYSPGSVGRSRTSAEGRTSYDYAETTVDGRSDGKAQAFPDELLANVPSLRMPPTTPSGDRFDELIESPFTKVASAPLSTFSIDVDTASYTKLRQYLVENHSLPTPGSLRIEELINYFDYDYQGPADNSPFAAHLRLTDCPWNKDHQLVRVAIQAKKVDTENRPASNLVFLIDVSGSMAAANKLPLVKRTLSLLASQVRENDRVAIVVYAGAAGCVLPSTPGSKKDAILASIQELQSGGSTNGGQGIELAYRIAKDNFVPGGINRVILCTDGDFNVGVTGTEQLVTMMQENAKSNVFLTCLGYGIGNYNDSMMEQISDKGNGTYAMVDNELEARRIMIEQLSGTLMTVAKDVKIQVEFNPARVASYRLLGYENRRLATADFDNDRKDAGEIGAGHRVTALYEIVPVGKEGAIPANVELRYGADKQENVKDGAAKDADPVSSHTDEWLYLKIRSKQPEATESTKQEFVLRDKQQALLAREQMDLDWAVSVAEFGLLLRQSPLAPGIDWNRMLSRAQECIGNDPYRRECWSMMQQAKQLSDRK